MLRKCPKCGEGRLLVCLEETENGSVEFWKHEAADPLGIGLYVQLCDYKAPVTVKLENGRLIRT